MSDDPLADFDLRARVAELEAERNVYRSAAWEYERRVAVAEARVAELEADLREVKGWAQAGEAARTADLKARVAELERKQCDCGAKDGR